MTIIYRTAGAWGVGKGGNLTPSEVDGNFYDLAQQIAALGAGPAPAEIDTITLVGTQMTITLDDAREFGPFTIPRAAFRWRGVWAASTAYAENDTFSVEDGGDDDGVYMVLKAHTSAGTFDPAALSGGDPLYQLMFASGAGGSGGSTRTAVTIDTATYDPVLATGDIFYTVNGFGGCAIEIPHDSTVDFPIGTMLQFWRNDAGTISIEADGVLGAYINWPTGFHSSGTATMTAGIGSVVTIVKDAANSWRGWGDLNPVT